MFKAVGDCGELLGAGRFGGFRARECEVEFLRGEGVEPCLEAGEAFFAALRTEGGNDVP